MRDLLEKALNKGLGVSFTTEGGFAVIRITKGTEVVASCSLGSADFRTSVKIPCSLFCLTWNAKACNIPS